MTAVQELLYQCPSCKRRDGLDVEALVWVRVTLFGTDPTLCESDSHRWDQTSAARCSACGWYGTARELAPGERDTRRSERSTEAKLWPRFSCPAGHSEGL